MNFYKKNCAKNKKGFSILEIIVSILIFSLVILLVNSMYVFSQRSYNKGALKAELTQNIRVALDRISRELRQSVNTITILPPVGDDILNPPVHEIFFEDGHDIDKITYLRYYLNGTDLMRKHTAYYFTNDPNVYVPWNSVDGLGSPPIELIIENRIIGEYFNSLEFWGANGLIHISAELLKNQTLIEFNTNVSSRN